MNSIRELVPSGQNSTVINSKSQHCLFCSDFSSMCLFVYIFIGLCTDLSLIFAHVLLLLFPQVYPDVLSLIPLLDFTFMCLCFLANANVIVCFWDGFTCFLIPCFVFLLRLPGFDLFFFSC